VPPFSLMSDTFSVEVDGYEPAEDENMAFYGNVVGSRYFETLGIAILRGRAFDERDQKDTLPVMVINETMAQRFWPGEDPVGATAWTRGQRHQVIGVARDVKYRNLNEEPQPYLYLSLDQRHIMMSSLHVRTFGDPSLLRTPIRSEVEVLEPNLPVAIRTMSEQMAFEVDGPAMVSGIIAGFGLLALVLAWVGVYGVMSYSVRQRTHEIGIRTALGAGSREIIRLVLVRGLMITAVGVAFGLGGAAALTRVFSGLLFQVSPLDPLIFFGVSVTLAAAVLLACFLPARWAARVDPALALHYE